MLELCTLASGSSGNCLLVSDGNTHILVDAGISARRICSGLSAHGLSPEDLSAILITHEHSDHIAGLSTLLKKHRIPLRTTQGTGVQLISRIPWSEPCLHTFSAGEGFAVGSLEVQTFSTPHDSADSAGFTISNGSARAAIATDLGHVTDQVLSAVRGADIALVETNYDPDWLETGPYPYPLKARIAGDFGHLSNEDGAALARLLAESGARHILLAHLSKENNTPERARSTVCRTLEHAGIHPGQDVSVAVAPRDAMGPVYQV